MATENLKDCLSFKAAADLSAKQFHAVKMSAAQTVDAVTGATDEAIGVLQNKPSAAGQAATVAVFGGGTCRLMAGAAITAGAYLKLTAAGRFVTGGAGGEENWAIALDSALADGDIIEARLISKLVS